MLCSLCDNAIDGDPVVLEVEYLENEDDDLTTKQDINACFDCADSILASVGEELEEGKEVNILMDPESQRLMPVVKDNN